MMKCQIESGNAHCVAEWRENGWFTYGNRFKIMTWGESHGEALGVVVDGCPAGLELCEEDIQKLLDRRKPGQSKFTTPRKEADKVRFCRAFLKGKRQEHRYPWYI